MRTNLIHSPRRLPAHFYLARREAAVLTLPLVAVAIVFIYAAVTISGGMWIFGPVALFSAGLGAWVYCNATERTLIFSITEAGISSCYWSFGLLPWADIRSFELKEIHIRDVGDICFLDFQLYNRSKYERHISNTRLAAARTDDVPLSIPLVYVDYRAASLKRLLQSQIERTRPQETVVPITAEAA